MNRIDLLDEPIAITIFEDPATGLAAFADLPEQYLDDLEHNLGSEAVAAMTEPSEIDRAFVNGLEVMPAQPGSYVAQAQCGELSKRVEALRSRGKVRDSASYFMAAINRSDEAVLGRTGGLYLVCPKGCHYCQYRGYTSYALGAQELAARMLALQKAGADNVQWISPSTHVGILLEALSIAAGEGLTVPIVYNSEGEDPVEVLQLLDGVVDVYLPDAKFINAAFAPRVGLPAGYGAAMQACLTEMYRQVGSLRRSDRGTAVRGLLVRHLIMPDGVDEARDVLTFLHSLDVALPLHVMSTYQPMHDARGDEHIGRHVTRDEAVAVAKAAKKLKMTRVLVR